MRRIIALLALAMAVVLVLSAPMAEAKHKKHHHKHHHSSGGPTPVSSGGSSSGPTPVSSGGLTPISSGGPTPVLDAFCPGPRDASDTRDGNARFAKTFTAQHSGKLTFAQISVGKEPGTSGDYFLEIGAVDPNSGVPTGNVLALATVPNSTVQDGESAITGNFVSPATVVAGQQYALIVTRTGSTQLTALARQNKSCPGKAFESLSQTDPFAEITAAPGFNFIFATFVSS